MYFYFHNKHPQVNISFNISKENSLTTTFCSVFLHNSVLSLHFITQAGDCEIICTWQMQVIMNTQTHTRTCYVLRNPTRER